jgi:hypothetical protein
VITLPFQGALSDVHLMALLKKVHPQSGGQKSDFFFPPGFTDRNALVTAQDENIPEVFNGINDLFYRFFIGDNHQICPPFSGSMTVYI